MAANDLTTLAAFKSYAQIDVSDTSADAVINRLITWASGVIRSHLDRAITIPTVTETRGFYMQDQKLLVFDDKVTNITQVVAPVGFYVEGELYDGSDVVDPANYVLTTGPAFSTLRLDYPVDGILEVSATYGWAASPSDLEYATTVQVDIWYRGNVIAPWNPPDDAEQKREEIPGNLSKSVKELLEPWLFKQAVT